MIDLNITKYNEKIKTAIENLKLNNCSGNCIKRKNKEIQEKFVSQNLPTDFYILHFKLLVWFNLLLNESIL